MKKLIHLFLAMSAACAGKSFESDITRAALGRDATVAVFGVYRSALDPAYWTKLDGAVSGSLAAVTARSSSTRSWPKPTPRPIPRSTARRDKRASAAICSRASPTRPAPTPSSSYKYGASCRRRAIRRRRRTSSNSRRGSTSGGRGRRPAPPTTDATAASRAGRRRRAARARARSDVLFTREPRALGPRAHALHGAKRRRGTRAIRASAEANAPGRTLRGVAGR